MSGVFRSCQSTCGCGFWLCVAGSSGWVLVGVLGLGVERLVRCGSLLLQTR